MHEEIKAQVEKLINLTVYDTKEVHNEELKLEAMLIGESKYETLLELCKTLSNIATALVNQNMTTFHGASLRFTIVKEQIKEHIKTLD